MGMLVFDSMIVMLTVYNAFETVWKNRGACDPSQRRGLLPTLVYDGKSVA
jgi:hypothetical protein